LPNLAAARAACRLGVDHDDKLGMPTYTVDFARNGDLLRGKSLQEGIQLGLSGRDEPPEVAQYLVRALGLDSEVRITLVSSDYFAEEYFAARPPSERLVSKKLDLLGLNIMRAWRVSLDDYLADAYAGYLDPC
jgi:dTDP-4-dehydrorhamnose reductase